MHPSDFPLVTMTPLGLQNVWKVRVCLKRGLKPHLFMDAFLKKKVCYISDVVLGNLIIMNPSWAQVKLNLEVTLVVCVCTYICIFTIVPCAFHAIQKIYNQSNCIYRTCFLGLKYFTVSWLCKTIVFWEKKTKCHWLTIFLIIFILTGLVRRFLFFSSSRFL